MASLLSAPILSLILAAEPALPDLETIRLNYLDAVSSIRTLECEMRIENELFRPDPRQRSEDRFSYSIVRLWRKGEKRSMRWEHYDGNGQLASGTNHLYDGRVYANWSFCLRPQEQRRFLPAGELSTEKSNRLYDEVTIDRLTGETWQVGDFPLAMLLQHYGPQVLDWDQVDGVPCVHVKFARHPPSRLKLDVLCSETQVWFDPAQRFLPRRLLSTNYLRGEDHAPSVSDHRVTEFREFSGVNGRSYVLPVAGERRSGLGVTSVRVLSVNINGNISNDHFIPTFPPLTKITERLANKQQRVYVKGDATERLQLEDAILTRLHKEEAARNGTPLEEPQSAPAPSARPTDVPTFPLISLLRTAGIVCVIVATALAWRRWRSTESVATSTTKA